MDRDAEPTPEGAIGGRLGPQLLPTGTVPRSEPGAPWWSYRRPEVPGFRSGREPEPRAAVAVATAPAEPATEPPQPRPGLEAVAPTRSAVLPASLAVLVAVAAIATPRSTDITAAGRVLLPLFGLLVAAAFVPMLTRRHPNEPWLGGFLMWGVAFKILMIFARYFTFGGEGDAGVYHEYGVKFINGVAPPLDAIRETGFVMYVIGHLYDIIGADQITGFLAFGLFAFIGSYLWYRATANAVPFVNRRMYCAFVFFLPSIAFWPASIGKEALMQFGIGAAALGTALLIERRLMSAVLVAAPGVYLLWAVRPHLFALVILSASMAFILGRGSPRPRGKRAQGGSLTRAAGTVLLAFISVFAISQAMHFLGIQNLSINSIEDELNEQAGRTAQGGSSFDEGKSRSLTPLSLPQGAVTVLLRPFVWEVETGTQIIASLEAAVITLLVIRRRQALAFSIARARSTPFLLYCWTLTALYAIAFSSFSNMGLLVRQRSLVLPAFFVLLCIEPALAERKQNDEGAVDAVPRGERDGQ